MRKPRTKKDLKRSDTRTMETHDAEIPQANWTVKLQINCPECRMRVDLTDNDDFWQDMRCGETRKNYEAYCPECGHEFVCRVEY